MPGSQTCPAYMPELIYRRAKALHDFRNALRFVGPTSNHAVENKVRIPNSAPLNFGSGEFAFSLWIYPVLRTINTDTQDKADYTILSLFQFDENPSSTGIALYLSAVGGNASSPATGIDSLRMQIRSRSPANQDVIRAVSAFPLPELSGKWSNVVFQRAGNAFEVWLNGIAVASVPIDAGEYINTIFGTTHLLGAGEGAAGFNGYMDEFAIYNRALSASEIQGLFNNGLGNIPPLDAFDNIVSYWRFDQHYGRTLKDYTSLYNNLYAPGNGTLLNYTDAQVNEGAQTAWVGHFTLVPSTFVEPPFGLGLTPVIILDATFTAPQGTQLNAYVPEVGPQFVEAATWITGPCVPWAFDGAGRVHSSTASYVFAAAPLNQSGLVRGVMEGMVYPVFNSGKGFLLLSNAAGTDMVRCQINRYGSINALDLVIVFDRAGQASVVHSLGFTAADGGELTGETDGSNVTVRYIQGGITRAQLTATAPAPYSGGHVGIFTGEGANSTISRFTVTRFT